MAVKRLCIYCSRFPCVKKDAEASVTTELVESYPFKSEEDALKPCEGDLFVPIETEERKPEPAKASEPKTLPGAEWIPSAIVTPKPPVQRVVIVKAGKADDLQGIVDKVQDNENVANVSGVQLSSVYDPDSGKVTIVLAILVQLAETPPEG